MKDPPGRSKVTAMVFGRAARALFHLVCYREVVPPGSVDDDKRLREGTASTQRFFARLPETIDVRGRSVLDLGCGHGETCFEVARRGARRVLGVEVADVHKNRELLATHFPELEGVVEFRAVGTEPGRLAGERFDLVLSKDTFEHVADPEGYVAEMRSLVAPGGLVVIGFGPLWKSPFGGHINFMTRMPWAHLLFPEDVVMRERRRFRPEEDARRFEDIKGGLNRMTLERFEGIMAGSGLRCRSFAVNRSDGRMIRLLKAPSRVPAVREYFTSNVYGVWEEQAGEPSSIASPLAHTST